MTENISFKHTFGALEKAIGISQQRHTLLTGNISNVDTPGYRPKDIDFQATLRQALQTSSGDALTRTHPDHIGSGGGWAPDLQIVEETEEWNGFNGVDVDREMGRLVENNLIYRTAVETLLRKIATLKEVIRDGGR